MDDPLYTGIRFALYADLMLLFGLPLFTLYTPGGGTCGTARRPVIASLAVLGLLLSGLAIAAMTASMNGVPLIRVDPGSIVTMVTDTPMGNAWGIRMSALAALIAALFVRQFQTVVTVLAAIALGSLAWTGHGAAGDGNAGTLQLIGDLVHLLAAAAWLGALVGLMSMVSGRTAPTIAHRALERFSSIGTLIVIAVVGSGLINSSFLVGWANLGKLPTTLYGQLLIAKLALFVAMIGLAAINRFRLTPALGRASRDAIDIAPRALRLSLAVESGAAIVILALVAWLGTLQPPTSL